MRQHWVPRSYLEAWADPATADRKFPLVWACNIEERRLFNPSVNAIFAEKHFYSIEKDDGTKDIGLEKKLAWLEGEFVAARARLARGEPRTADDEALFAAYGATMHARSKSMRDHHRQQWQQMLDKMKQLEGRIRAGGRNIQALAVEPSNPENVITQEHVEHMVDNTAAAIVPAFASIAAKVYGAMNRITLEAQGEETFITSDAPCVWLDNVPDDGGIYGRSPLMSKGLEVYMSISPRRCIVWSHHPKLTSDTVVPEGIVRSMNLWIAAHSKVLVRERPLFEKAFLDRPVLARAVAGVFSRPW